MENVVISSYLRRSMYPFSAELANKIMEDLRLLLASINDLQKKGILRGPFLFTSDISYLDDLWHELILHTRYYQTYCQENFGEFIHHDPNSGVEKVHFSRAAEQIERQMNLIADVLGEDFLERIYVVYPAIIKGGLR